MGLTTYDQYGTPEHRRQGNRRGFQANPINAVVVCQWNGGNDGSPGNAVFLTNAPVDKPLRPFDDEDDRSLIENCCINEAKQPWELGHPPQKTDRAVRVHVLFTLLTCALPTAYRRPCKREDRGGEPVDWQRWRRQLLEQTRDKVIVFAQGYDSIFHLAEDSLLLGVKLTDVPPGIGARQEIVAKYRLTISASMADLSVGEARPSLYPTRRKYAQLTPERDRRQKLSVDMRVARGVWKGQVSREVCYPLRGGDGFIIQAHAHEARVD